ncbi:MAG: hypothetical protein LC749_14820 [Actinobacteria bacterium]|nr:hypothetical protein [Actinomycetota bacterium]
MTTTTAADKAAVLGPRVDAAGATVAALKARIEGLHTSARHAATQGDFQECDAATAEAADRAAELATAETRLATLKAAQAEVQAAAQIDEHRANLVRHTAVLDQHRGEASRLVAGVEPALAEIRAALLAAEEHERTARQAARQAHQLRIALGEVPATPEPSGMPGEVMALLERNGLWREIRSGQHL